MAEDHELCTHFKYHKHKILLFLIAMRRYRDDLISKDFDVTYRELPDRAGEEGSFMSVLKLFIKKQKIETLTLYEIEDKFFENKIIALARQLEIELVIKKSPLFIVSRQDFKDYLEEVKSPFMKTFYEMWRRKTQILMEGDKPIGGKYSFDDENRKKLPKNCDPPSLHQKPTRDIPYFEEVSSLIEHHFPSHPGKCENFWLATSRREALFLLSQFIEERLVSFGTYQDAITSRSDFVFHSILSPYINMGLILPNEVIERVYKAYQKGSNIPLNSVEGFIRQVLGWREFVRGIYQEYDEVQQTTNFWKHEEKLNEHWYQGTTGIPPLDDAIKKADSVGYNHHIERLMVVANLMLLCRIHPQEAYRWFMEMFVDSSDWVMGPNVFGMGLFSDGGIFATKPYICGSNYLLKMSDYKKGAWCDVVDGLYWSFISDHKDYFVTNPRLSMMVRNLERMEKDKKDHLKRISKAAHDFRTNFSIS